MKSKLTALSLAVLLSVCSLPMITQISAFAENGTSMGSLGNVYGDYLYKVYDDHIEITATGVRARGDLIIPDEIEGLPVTVAGEHAFASNAQITSVTLPNTMTSIGKQAFYMDTGLTSVNLPDDITEIGEEAFLYCSKLTALTLPKSLSNIGVRAFLSCDGLTELQLPESLTNIGEYAFQDCSGLTAINIPEKITEIPTGAFMGCSGLKELLLPINVTRTGKMSIPDSVTRLTVMNPECMLDESLAYRSEDRKKLVTIIAPEGSQAQAFAEENGFSFEILKDTLAIVQPTGDINQDGKLDVLDVIAVNKWLLKKGSLPNWKYADYNQDGKINIFDLCLMKKALLQQLKVMQTAKPLGTSLKAETVSGMDADEIFINGQMNFYLSLLQNTAKEGENCLISPYSVVQALGMAANGATGETKSQMEQVLGGMKMETLNAYLYTQRSCQPDILKTANSIWYRDSNQLNVSESFLQTNANYYQASAFQQKLARNPPPL